MRRFPSLLFTLLIVTDLTIWLLQKRAATDSAAAEHFFVAVLFHPELWLALGGALVQLALWRAILKRADLTHAFPLLSVSYPLALLASTFLLHESPTWGTWIGALMVMAGVMLVGDSGEHGAPRVDVRTHDTTPT